MTNIRVRPYSHCAWYRAFSVHMSIHTVPHSVADTCRHTLICRAHASVHVRVKYIYTCGGARITADSCGTKYVSVHSVHDMFSFCVLLHAEPCHFTSGVNTAMCFHVFDQLDTSISTSYCTVTCNVNGAATVMVHAFVMSRVDYCNGVFDRVTLPMSSLNRTCSVLQLESYCVSGSSTTSPLTFEIDYIGCPFSRELKVCVLVYKCLHQATPA